MLISNSLFIDEEYKQDIKTRIDYHDFVRQIVSSDANTIYNAESKDATTGTINSSYLGMTSGQLANNVYYKVKGITEMYGKAIPYEN